MHEIKATYVHETRTQGSVAIPQESRPVTRNKGTVLTIRSPKNKKQPIQSTEHESNTQPFWPRNKQKGRRTEVQVRNPKVSAICFCSYFPEMQKFGNRLCRLGWAVGRCRCGVSGFWLHKKLKGKCGTGTEDQSR